MILAVGSPSSGTKRKDDDDDDDDPGYCDIHLMAAVAPQMEH